MLDDTTQLANLFSRIGIQSGTIIANKSIQIYGFKTYIVSNFAEEGSILIRSHKSNKFYINPDQGNDIGKYELRV